MVYCPIIIGIVFCRLRRILDPSLGMTNDDEIDNANASLLGWINNTFAYKMNSNAVQMSSIDWHLLEIMSRASARQRHDGSGEFCHFSYCQNHKKLRFFKSQQCHTAWQDPGDDSYSPDHPRNYKVHSLAGFVNRKTLEEKLYQETFDSFTFCFVYIVVGRTNDSSSSLFESQDENGAVHRYRTHNHHRPPWNFDEASYTTILYLQKPESRERHLLEWVPSWARPTWMANDWFLWSLDCATTNFTRPNSKSGSEKIRPSLSGWMVFLIVAWVILFVASDLGWLLATPTGMIRFNLVWSYIFYIRK